MNSGKKLIKHIRLIKKIAGHEARLERAKQEIAERWNGSPPDGVGWRVGAVEKLIPDSRKRETSREIDVLLGEIEGRLMVDYAITGEKQRRGASEGGRERSKWPERKAELQNAVNDAYANHPGHTYAAIQRHAEKKLQEKYPKKGIAAALKRYTTNPTKK